MDPWTSLLVAGVFEVGMTTFLRLEQRSGWYVLGFLPCAFISFTLLSDAARVLPLGLAYALWTGIGAVGTVLVGALFFRDRLNRKSLGVLTLVVGLMAALKVVE